jgi:UDP-sulfoquinovose synthase
MKVSMRAAADASVLHARNRLANGGVALRVFIAGIDGYLGWSLAKYLGSRGHEVGGADNFSRRDWVEEMGSWSAIPIATMKERLEAFEDILPGQVSFWEGDLTEFDFVEATLRDFQPDAVVQLGECPSAPYSMIDVHHAVFVQMNNLVGTFNLLFAMRDHAPGAHLLKLGTMGEYGTPSIDIPEGFFEIEYRGRRDRLPFPRQANSWYHWSKVHGSNNVMFACKIWGLAATDVMQGVVFGTRADNNDQDPRLRSRLDFDQCFGTAINRYCCEAVIGHALTPYGKGHQRRGFLPLRDSMQCLTLALENPPAPAEYRVFNQFEEVYDVTELALKVQKAAGDLGLEVRVENLENPRMEAEQHHYNPDHQALLDLGYRPTHDVDAELRLMLQDLVKHHDRIEAKRHVIVPDFRWDGRRERVQVLDRVTPDQA